MKVIIDRFEADFAIVETEKGNFSMISKNLLENAKEGDIIDISISNKETEDKKQEVKTLLDELFE